MGFLSGLFHSRDKPTNSTNGSAYRFFFGGSNSGKAVNEKSAMQMTAVYACVRILSESIAGLPVHIYKYTDSGSKEKAIKHPLYRLIHDDPNPEMTSFVFRETLMTHLVTMLNKLIYGHRLILVPYLKALENSSGDEALQRIQHLELLLDQNSEQRETLTKLMAQGYIDQILYNQETNALLLQAETYRSDIEAITICMTGNSAKVTETNLLLHFVSHADMLTNYSEELFESYADHIEISGRNEIRFVMKCGLTFTERIGD